MEKILTTNYTLKEEEIKQYKERIKQEIPEALLDLENGNKIRTINSYMDYFMNEIIMTKIDELIETKFPECNEKYKFDNMNFNIHDSHNENSIELGIVYFDKENEDELHCLTVNINLKVLYDDKKDCEYVDDVTADIKWFDKDDTLIPFDYIKNVIISFIKAFNEEIFYVVKAMNAYVERVKYISSCIINATNKESNDIRLNVAAHGNKVVLILKNNINRVLNYIDMDIINYSKKDGLTILHNEKEYMNLGKSILYAIRNMIDNQLF